MGDGQLNFQERCRVSELTINPAVTDADFTFEEQPGMLIACSKVGGSPDPRRLMVFAHDNQYYRIGEDGHRHEVTFENGIEQPVESPWPFWSAGLLVGTMLLAGLRWWQPWKSTSGRPG
jgi:hypothetical protein